MHTRLLTVAALLVFAAPAHIVAQQASGQDDRANAGTERQTTSATWTTSAPPPEQAGDLYQSKTRSDGNFSAAATRDDPLPGALNPGIDPLAGNKQPDPRE